MTDCASHAWYNRAGARLSPAAWQGRRFARPLHPTRAGPLSPLHPDPASSAGQALPPR